MRLRQIGQHLGEELEPDQKTVQRIFVEIVSAPENAVEQLVVLLEITQQQTLGQLALVLEVIEKAALRNAGRRDQLFNRGGGKPFRKHRALRKLEQSLAGVAGLAGGILEHGALYHGCSSCPRGRAETPRPFAIPLKKHAKNSARA